MLDLPENTMKFLDIYVKQDLRNTEYPKKKEINKSK